MKYNSEKAFSGSKSARRKVDFKLRQEKRDQKAKENEEKENPKYFDGTPIFPMRKSLIGKGEW